MNKDKYRMRKEEQVTRTEYCDGAKARRAEVAISKRVEGCEKGMTVDESSSYCRVVIVEESFRATASRYSGYQHYLTTGKQAPWSVISTTTSAVLSVLNTKQLHLVRVCDTVKIPQV